LIEHRQRLALRLEPRGHRLPVHAELDELQRHATAHRLRLLRDIHHAAPAFTNLFQQLVAPQRLACRFVELVLREFHLHRALGGGGGIRGQRSIRFVMGD
jgi:hypothetical protein